MYKNWIIVLIFFSCMSSSWAWEISSTSSKYDKDSLELKTFIEEAHWANEDLMISTIGHGECTGVCSWNITLDQDKIILTHQFKDQKYPRACGTAMLKAPLYRSTLKIHGLKKDNYQISYANDSMKLNSNNTITDYCDQRVNYDCYLRHFFQIYTKISLQANEPRIEFGTPQEEKIASKYPLFMTYFKEELAGDSLFMDYSQRDDAGVNKITYEPENQWISFSRTRLDGHVTSSNLYEAEGRSFERAIKAYVGANKRRVDIASQIKKRSGLDIIKVYENERMEILWNGEKISYGQSRIYFSDRPGSATFLFDMPFPSIKNISKEEFTHLMNLAKRAYEVVSQIPNMAYPPEHVSIKKDIQQAHVYVKLLPGEKASERFIQVHNRTITVPIGKSFEIDLVTKTYKEAQ